MKKLDMNMKINVSKKNYRDSISSSETQKYIDYLEESEEFEIEVKKIRKKYQIDEKWFAIPEEEQSFDGDFNEFFGIVRGRKLLSTFIDDCSRLTTKLNLPHKWSYSLIGFVAYNIFPVLEKPEFESYMGNSFRSNSRWVSNDTECKDTVHLVVKESVSRPQLHELIDQNWDRIAECMNLLPNPKRHKWLRSELAKRIVQLRDEMKLQFPELAETLAKENEDDIDLYSKITEDYVKNLYHRWKKKVSST